MAILNIIGNGFDRSHGLKTSYGDFIKYLINESINYNNDVRNNLFDVGKISNEDQSYETIKVKFRDFINTKQIVFKNNFLRILMDKFFEADWIEIEEYYFEILKNIKNDNLKQLQNLHQEFIQLKNYLEKYLDNQTIEDTTYLEEYVNLFKDDKHLDNFFLNFNYTNTLEKYLPKLKLRLPDFNFKTTHIHGKLLDKENPIIFGYGDENEDYFRIRNYNNEYTLFHKTHIYPLKLYKRSLFSFLNETDNKNDIQVNIFGHSCGISDRILLRQIFEHKNVIRIKIYFHEHKNGNNFQDISSNIFKTLNDNSIIDEKLVPMPNCFPMVQV